MHKNIVVFSDGTGQEGGKGFNTNVYKLFNMIEDRTEHQISFYDRGLGTGWRKITGNVAGMGISKNIMECYEFIFENYQAGDNIFLFGFSRGATTVRSLSGFIHLFGILPKSRPELIKEAYKIYKESNEQKRIKKAKDFLSGHHNQWCKIKFLGVWDTVAALGIPFKAINVIVNFFPFFRHKYHNLKLSSSVTHARHALAIDDERKTFHPKIWDKEIGSSQTMKQVWFCGIHTDVGGGYNEQQLSDIPLIWMMREAEEIGLRIYKHHDVYLDPDQNGFMHDSRKGFPKNLFRREERFWNSKEKGELFVHESVLERDLNQQNEPSPAYAPWILSKDHKSESWPDSQRTVIHGNPTEALAKGVKNGIVLAEDTNYNVLIEKSEIVGKNVDSKVVKNHNIISGETAFDKMKEGANLSLAEENIELEQLRKQKKSLLWFMWLFLIVGLVVIIISLTLNNFNNDDIHTIFIVAGIVFELIAFILLWNYRKATRNTNKLLDKVYKTKVVIKLLKTIDSIKNDKQRNDEINNIITSTLRMS